MVLQLMFTLLQLLLQIILEITLANNSVKTANVTTAVNMANITNIAKATVTANSLYNIMCININAVLLLIIRKLMLLLVKRSTAYISGSIRNKDCPQRINSAAELLL